MKTALAAYKTPATAVCTLRNGTKTAETALKNGQNGLKLTMNTMKRLGLARFTPIKRLTIGEFGMSGSLL